MPCTPVASSKEADLCEKCDKFLDFDNKLSVICILLEIFRRLNAISRAFYTPIATHAAFSVETIPTVRKVRPFTPFWRKLSVISILLGIFRRLNAISIAFDTPIATHAAFSVETIPTVRKVRTYTRSCRKRSVISLRWRHFDVYTLFLWHFTFRMLCMPVASSKEADLCEKCDKFLDFDDKLSVISLLLEIFRRLDAISRAVYTAHATRAVFRVETIPTVRKMRTYTRSCRKRSVISLRWRHFDVYTLFPSHFTRRMLRTPLLASKHAQLHAKYDHLLDFDDTLRVISLYWRYFDVYTLFPSHFTCRKLCTPVP